MPLSERVTIHNWDFTGETGSNVLSEVRFWRTARNVASAIHLFVTGPTVRGASRAAQNLPEVRTRYKHAVPR